MEPISKLNQSSAPRRIRRSWLLLLCVGLSVALLYRQLATLYARPTPTAAPMRTRLPVAGPNEAVTIPAGPGFQRIALQQGLLLASGPDQRLIGQQSLSLCEQQRDPTAATLLPLYVGWDWAQLREAAMANLTAQPPRPAHYGLKNPMVDDGPGGIDVPAFQIAAATDETALRPYGDGETLRLTLRDQRPALLLADTGDTAAGPVLAFRYDAWLLWNGDGRTVGDRSDYAVRVQRLPDRDCPLGQLQVGVYGPPEPGTGETDGGLRRVLWYAGGPVTREFRLAPGHYAASAAPPAPREDAVLFERALAAGLLRLGEDGRVAIAPADLPLIRAQARDHPELLAPHEVGPDWLSGPWDEAIRQIHRALHFSAAGRYVRQQVEAFNARQLWAAVRWKAANADQSGEWRADWAGAPLVLTASMPLLAGKLFPEVPQGWQPWRRVARWPLLEEQTPVRFRLTLTRPARRGERLEVLVAGGEPTVSGAVVVASQPRCLDVTPCSARAAVAHWLRLEWRAGATDLELRFMPLPASAFPDGYRYEFSHLRLEDGQLVWRDSPTGGAGDPARPAPAEVTVRDRAGAMLLEHGQPTAAAWALGLAALVGLDPAQSGDVASVLARLSLHGASIVDARLSVDPRLQSTARQALLARLPQVAAAFGDRDPWREVRIASLVVLDADKGDILAVVDSPEPPSGAVWSDLYSFAAGQPRRSPLRIWAWQHDGGAWQAAGSTFKLVDALLLEREARHRLELAAALAGLSADEMAQWPLAKAYDFGVDAACYPAHASSCAAWARQPGQRYDRPDSAAVHNFRGAAGVESPLERMHRTQDERYGLAQALRDSLNTWFAWLVETTDATLLDDPTAAGLATVRALTPNALRGARPLLDLTAELGFGASENLDGGLLPTGLVEAGDVLQTTASSLDPITSRAQVRLAALGFRMQVTPLQLAEIAAAIASGRRVTPRLLLEVNGRPALAATGTALRIATERIKDGMARVALDGTAQAAFAGARFDAIRPFLRLKTGTADLDEAGTAHNAWLTGWLEPGALPGEPRRLAFTCLISHAAGTGGEECGAVIAAWLTSLTETGPDG